MPPSEEGDDDEGSSGLEMAEMLFTCNILALVGREGYRAHVKPALHYSVRLR